MLGGAFFSFRMLDVIVMNVIMLSVVMLSVTMLSGIMLSGTRLSVNVPNNQHLSVILSS